jgi:hypothetical protein
MKFQQDRIPAFDIHYSAFDIRFFKVPISISSGISPVSDRLTPEIRPFQAGGYP